MRRTRADSFAPLEVISVRKASAALVAMMFGLLCMSTPAVAAPGSSAPLRGVIVDMTATWPIPPLGNCPATPPPGIVVDDPTGCWYGHVQGDIDGVIAFWESDANYVVGQTEHFFETFAFWPDSGGYITGADVGLWSFANGKFHSNGWVTGTSPEWTGLLGYKYFEMGTTTDPNGWPITAYGTELFLAKA